MGQSLDLTTRRVQAFRGMLKGLWNAVERHHLSFAEYTKDRNTITGGPDYKSLPIWAKEHLRGYDLARYDAVWREMVFSYILDNVRVTVNSPEWHDAATERYELETKGTFDTDSGKHVWKDAPEKIWQ